MIDNQHVSSYEKKFVLTIPNNLGDLLFIIVLLFVGIYEPVLFSFSLRHLVGLYSLGYVILHGNLISRNFSQGFIQKLIVAYLFITVYVCIVTFLNGNQVWSAEVQNIHMLIYIIPFCLTIATKCQIAGVDQEGFLTLVIWTAVLQAFIAMLCMMFGGIQNSILNLYLTNLDQSTADILSRYTYRLYGFASNYTSFMSYFQAFAAVICFYRAFHNSYTYYLWGVFISLSALINTRTSGILLIIGIVICLFKVKNAREVFRVIVAVLMTLLLGSAIIKIFSSLNPEGYDWWVTEFNKLMNTVETGDTSLGFMAYFVKESTWEIPNNLLQFLFGTGVRVMGGSIYGARTDVGYINDIWYGGIVYTLALYIGLARWMKKEISDSCITEEFRLITTIMFIFLLVTNLKGQSFKINDCYKMFIMLLCFARMSKINESNDIEEMESEVG